MKRVLIGCDPEFVVISPTGRVVRSEYVQFINTEKSGIFGHDADGLFELRPPPCSNIFILIDRIRTILNVHINKYPRFKKCKFIGGHHVEVDQKHYYMGGQIGRAHV